MPGKQPCPVFITHETTVVWEIFNSKNILWALATHKKWLHENLLPRLINS